MVNFAANVSLNSKEILKKFHANFKIKIIEKKERFILSIIQNFNELNVINTLIQFNNCGFNNST